MVQFLEPSNTSINFVHSLEVRKRMFCPFLGTSDKCKYANLKVLAQPNACFQLLALETVQTWLVQGRYKFQYHQLSLQGFAV